GLSVEYLKTIREHFRRLGRAPTDVELETLGQTWSEHCKHTIFASPMDELTDGIYRTYIKGATKKIRAKKGAKDFCLSVFKDNSGGIAFDKNWVVTHKVETHNTPSALDPFGGAITGIVGVNRDSLGFGLGAKPVANVYGFCFAPPEDPRRLYRDRELTQELLPAKRIAEGVIKGINAGGNQSGIPTPQGFMLFDDSYRGKPLVFAGTVGLIPKTHNGRKLYEKKAKPGDYIVMVGGRVGLDGIHGATFSSAELHSGSPATAVQIGDPITQKKFSDAIAKEARDMGLYDSITDNGAGGLSSSVGEMAKESGGCRVELEKVPLKYDGHRRVHEKREVRRLVRRKDGS
ncbi:phosphoribosylformylglycinamidine synthase, partial [Candidatus Kaiserbacteria bacterium]|nr:phosphoribosylformylglycinamidine synthase [Candidatus Kaiserbacteria bacterium]